jgi:hypothetical protein
MEIRCLQQQRVWQHQPWEEGLPYRTMMTGMNFKEQIELGREIAHTSGNNPGILRDSRVHQAMGVQIS